MTKINKNLRLRRLQSYFEAIENEIALDELGYRLLNIIPSDYGFIPRPSKWIQHTSKFSSLLVKSLRLIRHFWIYGLGVFFFLVELCRFLFNRKGTILKEIPEKKIALGFSFRATQIVNDRHIHDAPVCWLTFPWVDSSALPDNIKKYSLTSFLTVANLVEAYKLSLLSIRYFSRYSGPHWVLQTYTAFPWFCARLALEKIDGKFFVAEHFDRWAVLVDGVCREHKRRSRSVEFAIVQHGFLGEISSKTKMEIPYKLKEVDELHVYNRESADFFMNEILSGGINRERISVLYYISQLNINNAVVKAGYKVLFVGHPLCEDLHISLYGRMTRQFVFHAFYKPHPINKESEKIDSMEWDIVKGKSNFPGVDLVIAYPSTLVVEYQSLGTDTIVHPIDMGINDSDEIWTAIEEKLQENAVNIFPA